MKSRVRFSPNHDEAARQAFVGSLKKYVNFTVEPALARRYSDILVPAHLAEGGSQPESRDDAASLLEGDFLYNLWGTLTYHSQNLMWDAVQLTTDRTISDQVAAFEAICQDPERLGRLRLSDTLVVKAPVATTEIHRQPGGYWRERRANDLEAALNYSGTVELYRNAKGMSAGARPAPDAMGQFVASVARRYAPDLSPTAILDMGCGTGEQTLAYKREFPSAQVTGIDCARPFVRYAHAHAESERVAVDFAEMDAAQTDFADASIDLIVSIIMFHETSKTQIRDILRECYRILRPGGLMLHLDVPYQPARMSLVSQVTNHWQVRNNGEPFWSGFAELDMREEVIAAGFDPADAFARYESVGPATYYFFGGRKS